MFILLVMVFELRAGCEVNYYFFLGGGVCVVDVKLIIFLGGGGCVVW